MIPALFKIALSESGFSHQFADGTKQVGSPSFDEVLKEALQPRVVSEVSGSAETDLESEALRSAEVGEHQTLAEDGFEIDDNALIELQSEIDAGLDTDAFAQDVLESTPSAVVEISDDTAIVSLADSEENSLPHVEEGGEKQPEQTYLGGFEAPRSVALYEVGGGGSHPRDLAAIERQASAPAHAPLDDAIIGKDLQTSSLVPNSTESSASAKKQNSALPELDFANRKSLGETGGATPLVRVEAKQTLVKEAGQGFESRTESSRTAQMHEQISNAKGLDAAIIQSKNDPEKRAIVTPQPATAQQNVQMHTTAVREPTKEPQQVAFVASYQSDQYSAAPLQWRSDDVAPEALQAPQDSPEPLVGVSFPSLPATQAIASTTKAAPKISLTLPQVAEVVELGVRSEMNGEIEIELRPLDLGRMKLVFKQDAQGLSVTVDAENPETVEQIKRHLESLTVDARANPDTAPRFRFEGGSFGQNAREGQTSQRQTRGAFGRGFTDESSEASSINTPQTVSDLVSGNLDIRA